VTGKVLATLAVVVVLGGIIAVGYVLSRRESRDVVPGAPDRLSEDLVSGLMAELRKCQAEAAYWKAAAERLQREVDRR
jgi:hypothetical protein